MNTSFITVLWTPKGNNTIYLFRIEIPPPVVELPIKKEIEEPKVQIDENENVNHSNNVILPVQPSN